MRLSQNEIADVIYVDKSFVSRVRTLERELSTTHMQLLAEHLHMPVGAMLMLTHKPSDKSKNPEYAAIEKMCIELMHLADEVAGEAKAAIRKRQPRKAS